MKHLQKTLRLFQVLVFLIPAIGFGQSATPTPSLEELEQEVNDLRTDLNQLEVKNDSIQQNFDKNYFPIHLDGISIEQDFEANSPNWDIVQGQTVQLKLSADPTKDVSGHLDLQIIGKSAPDIFVYSYNTVFASQNTLVVVKEADATFNTSLASFHVFAGEMRAGYYNSSDDLYYLYPDQYDPDTAFRVSGRPVPTGMEIQGLNELSGFDFVLGPELVWGFGPMAYGKYQFNIDALKLGVIERIKFEGETPIGETPNNYFVPPQSATEFTFSLPVEDLFTFDQVLLYNPANVNQPYTYVQPVAPGTGFLGTGYDVYQSTTQQTDALGYQIRLTLHHALLPFLDTMTLNAEDSGVLAGNLQRFTGEIEQIPAEHFLFTANATVQKPLVGPNPLITSSSNGEVPIIEPRGELDPFVVGTDPFSGRVNREMTKFSLSFVYNPGSGWFFKYNPNVFDSYNVNVDLDTPFSEGIIGTLFDYQTGTDLTNYISATGTPGTSVWEGYGNSGLPATNGYLPDIHSITMWKTGQLHWIADVETGYQLATLSESTVTNAGIGAGGSPNPSSRDFFQGTLTTWINGTRLSFTYAQDTYGPEYWQQQFGFWIGQRYVAKISQKFGDSEVSFKYERWQNLPGDPYQLAPGEIFPVNTSNPVTLPIDEIYSSYTLNF